MKYVDAVKWVDRLMPETDLPDEGIEALAVLRRAEGVMGAVEGAELIEDDGEWRLHVDEDWDGPILRAALRYKETQ